MKNRAKSKRTVKIYDSNLNAEQIERVLYVNRVQPKNAKKWTKEFTNKQNTAINDRIVWINAKIYDKNVKKTSERYR